MIMDKPLYSGMVRDYEHIRILGYEKYSMTQTFEIEFF